MPILLVGIINVRLILLRAGAPAGAQIYARATEQPNAKCKTNKQPNLAYPLLRHYYCSDLIY